MSTLTQQLIVIVPSIILMVAIFAYLVHLNKRGEEAWFRAAQAEGFAAMGDSSVIPIALKGSAFLADLTNQTSGMIGAQSEGGIRILQAARGNWRAAETYFFRYQPKTGREPGQRIGMALLRPKSSVGASLLVRLTRSGEVQASGAGLSPEQETAVQNQITDPRMVGLASQGVLLGFERFSNGELVWITAPDGKNADRVLAVGAEVFRTFE